VQHLEVSAKAAGDRKQLITRQSALLVLLGPLEAIEPVFHYSPVSEHGVILSTAIGNHCTFRPRRKIRIMCHWLIPSRIWAKKHKTVKSSLRLAFVFLNHLPTFAGMHQLRNKRIEQAIVYPAMHAVLDVSNLSMGQIGL
jgi:hypothetical protein